MGMLMPIELGRRADGGDDADADCNDEGVRAKVVGRNIDLRSCLRELERVVERGVGLEDAIELGGALRRVCVECTIVVDEVENGKNGVQAGRQIRFCMSP